MVFVILNTLLVTIDLKRLKKEQKPTVLMWMDKRGLLTVE